MSVNICVGYSMTNATLVFRTIYGNTEVNDTANNMLILCLRMNFYAKSKVNLFLKYFHFLTFFLHFFLSLTFYRHINEFVSDIHQWNNEFNTIIRNNSIFHEHHNFESYVYYSSYWKQEGGKTIYQMYF